MTTKRRLSFYTLFEYTPRNKLNLLELAEYLKNASEACKVNGVSRQVPHGKRRNPSGVFPKLPYNAPDIPGSLCQLPA
jgi:hypothetical protein